MQHLTILLPLLMLSTAPLQPAFSCSAFIAEENGLILVGNNEDYWNPFTKMWVVKGVEGKLGCV